MKWEWKEDWREKMRTAGQMKKKKKRWKWKKKKRKGLKRKKNKEKKKRKKKYSNLKKEDNSIIIIIMSRRQRGYPWPSLAISPYYSSPPAGLQGYILCPPIVAVCKFVLVVLLLHIHMWGSTGVHRLWARPCFSSSVPRVWFVWLV